MEVAMRRRLFDLARRASNWLFGPELLHRSPLARGLFDSMASVVRALSPAHRRMRAFQRANPDAPWLVPASIPAIEALLRPGMRVFEWGAGRSTLWLARQGVELISVEGRPGWHVAVRRMLGPWRVGLYDDGICQTALFRAPPTGFALRRGAQSPLHAPAQALTSRYVL
jgi:hypothetical protein